MTKQMNKTKILLVEDDAEIARLTAMYLEVEGFQVVVVDDGALALAAIEQNQPQLIILDLMLPGLSGIEICQRARAFYQQPILILTACDDDVSEVSLLKMGADDYLVKPLRPHVLVARIEALLRRGGTGESQSLSHSIVIDDKSTQASYKGQWLDLTGGEYEMLRLLHNNVGQVISRDQCCQALRGIEHDLSNRSIDMRISGLRKKLGDGQMPYKVILTIRNQGYQLVDE